MAASSSSNECDTRFNIITNSSDDAEFSVNLKLPKFSNNCTDVDFLSALETKVNKEEITYLGKLRFSNEWQVTFTSKSTRDQLLELGSFSVKGKKCIVYPCGRQAVGRIHWLPIDVPEDIIKDILRHFGEISKFGCEKLFPTPESPQSLVRFFILNLHKNCKPEDLPHFISVNKHQGLVIVKGRDPMCLECRQIGHRKKVCPVVEKKRAERDAKNHKKGKKKSKTDIESMIKNLKIEDNATGSNSSSKKKKKTPSKQSVASTACSSENPENSCLIHDSKEGIHSVANDVKRLQQLMNIFSQKVNEVLSNNSLDAGSDEAAELTVEQPETTEATNTLDTSKQMKKKKKKKSKTSGNYDLVAAEVVGNDTSSSSQHSSKASLDSGIASTEHSTSNSSDNADNNGNNCSRGVVHVNSSEISNAVRLDNANIQSKKKKNKKKKSGGPTIPGLTQP